MRHMGPFDLNLHEQFHSLTVFCDDELKIAMTKVNSHRPEEMRYEVQKII